MTKTVPIKFSSRNFDKKKKVNCKIEHFYILLNVILITISLFIIVNIYCCLIAHRPKQESFLPYHDTSSKLKETDITNII